MLFYNSFITVLLFLISAAMKYYITLKTKPSSVEPNFYAPKINIFHIFVTKYLYKTSLLL